MVPITAVTVLLHLTKYRLLTSTPPPPQHLYKSFSVSRVLSEERRPQENPSGGHTQRADILSSSERTEQFSGSVLQNSGENARRQRRFNSCSEGIRSARCFNIDSRSKCDGNVSRDSMKIRKISPHHFSFFELTPVSLE